MAEPITYLVAHLHDTPLADERLHEQAIEIVVVGERLEPRRGSHTRASASSGAAGQRPRPDIEVIDDLHVSRIQEPADEPEQL